MSANVIAKVKPERSVHQKRNALKISQVGSRAAALLFFVVVVVVNVVTVVVIDVAVVAIVVAGVDGGHRGQTERLGGCDPPGFRDPGQPEKVRGVKVRGGAEEAK